MALFKYGIPDGVKKDCRVSLHLTHPINQMFLKFGLIAPNSNTSTARVFTNDDEAEMMTWARQNLKGYVYHIRHQYDRDCDDFVWELFFKSPADAIMFKLRWSC
jgi:hypothetical protein